MISDDDYARTELQNRILEVSQNGLELANYSITAKSENKTITDTFQNLKELCMSLYKTVGDNLLEYLHNCPILKQEKIDEALRLNAFNFLNFQNNYNSKEIINTCDFSFVDLIDFLVI